MNLKPLLLAPPISLLLGFGFGWMRPNPDDLIILNVGQGDCAVLRHGGITVLIDDGPAPHDRPDSGSTIRDALRRADVDNVDFVLLSHPDADHVSGTPEVRHEFPSARIVMSSEFATMPKMLSDLRSWSVDPRSVLWLPEKSSISFSGCELRIECPQLDVNGDDNRGSMFVHVNDEGATADFSGDAPQDVEAAVAQQGGWQADLLHVGHHGSKTATGEEWLSTVRPRVAVISCGVDNPYGHPHRSVLERLQTHHIAIERTDQSGDLTFVPKNGRFEAVR
jgi:competence protein ComEC